MEIGRKNWTLNLVTVSPPTRTTWFVFRSDASGLEFDPEAINQKGERGVHCTNCVCTLKLERILIKLSYQNHRYWIFLLMLRCHGKKVNLPATCDLRLFFSFLGINAQNYNSVLYPLWYPIVGRCAAQIPRVLFVCLDVLPNNFGKLKMWYLPICFNWNPKKHKQALWNN